MLLDVPEVQSFHTLIKENDPITQNPSQTVSGKCPHRPGDLKSAVSPDFDISKLDGLWRTVYDEAEMKEVSTC